MGCWGHPQRIRDHPPETGEFPSYNRGHWTKLGSAPLPRMELDTVYFNEVSALGTRQGGRSPGVHERPGRLHNLLSNIRHTSVLLYHVNTASLTSQFAINYHLSSILLNKFFTTTIRKESPRKPTVHRALEI